MAGFGQIHNWRTVAEEYPGEVQRQQDYREVADAIVFADYSIASWYYAAKCGDRPERETPILLLHTTVYPVADSLTDSWLALEDDPAIYPPRR